MKNQAAPFAEPYCKQQSMILGPITKWNELLMEFTVLKKMKRSYT